MTKHVIANTNPEHIYSKEETISFVNRYRRQGFAPTPVAFKGKNPLLAKWPQIAIADSELSQHFSDEPRNIGIVLGPLSNKLVDVDIDDRSALLLAPSFLPKTGMIFGRKSKPRSHWIYYSTDTKSSQFRRDGRMIIEIRGKDNQTVFPGSIHKSKEKIEFDSDDEPAHVEREGLNLACLNISIGSVLLKHWKSGSRHGLALATAGLLANAGWEETDAKKLVETVAREAADNEIEDRLACVSSTFRNRECGKQITGQGVLAQLLDHRSAANLASWASKAADSQLPVSLTDSVVQSADLSTDFRAAKTFAHQYGGKIIYCEAADSWFRKDNQIYRSLSKVQIQGRAGRFAHELGQRIASRLPGGGYTHIRTFEAYSRINHMVDLAKDDLRVDWDSVDKAENLIGLEDGSAFDLDRDDIVCDQVPIITKSLGVSVYPEAECPSWVKFLEQIFENDQDVIRFVQRAVGYSLTGKTDEQCLFLLVGKGSNGKSTFLNVLHHLFGDYAETIPMHTLMIQRYGSDQTNDLALLPGKRFVTATEGELGQRLAESRIKLMTGGDPISCRRLYHDYFKFRPQFKLWLATNNLPRIGGTDEAIWRRIHVVDFPVTIRENERDADLPHKLRIELPGILNWALAGCSEWRRQKLNPPGKVKKTTSAYRMDNDTVAQFIEGCCDSETAAITMAKTLYDRYADWCEQSGHEAMHKNTFGKTLAQKGFQKVSRREGSAWKGLKLRRVTFDLGELDQLLRSA